MPLVIGIAGSIATGKSTACSLITEMGAVHSDADRLVHRLYDPGKPAYYRIIEIFGDEVVGEDEYIDRKVLGSKVSAQQPPSVATSSASRGALYPSETNAASMRSRGGMPEVWP